MNVTIIADASYCPDTGAAGYGWWIACQRGKLGGHGVLKTKLVNNIAAEMMALVNAFLAGCQAGLIQQHDQVLMQTDCTAAINIFKESTRNKATEQELQIAAKLHEYQKRAGVATSYRHVKGHTTTQDARSHVNRQCDQQARKHMRNARAQINGEENETG